MLIYLVKGDGEKTPMGVARFFKTSKAMATNMISSLTKKGYLKKEQSEFDKRCFLLVPTEKAVLLVDETYEEYFKSMLLLKNKMGEREFQELITLLEKANHFLLEEKENG